MDRSKSVKVGKALEDLEWMSKGERRESVKRTHSFCYTTCDTFTDACATFFDAFADSFQASAGTEFHHDLYFTGRGRHVSAVELNDIEVFAAGGDGEFTLELFQRGFACGDRLSSKDSTRSDILDFVDGAALTFTQSSQLLQDGIRPPPECLLGGGLFCGGVGIKGGFIETGDELVNGALADVV